MEELVKILFTGENLRMLVTLAAVGAGVVWLNLKMEVRFSSLRDEMHRENTALRDEMHNTNTSLREEMRRENASLREEMHTANAALREEMHTANAALREEMHAATAALREEMRAENASLREAIQELKTNDIAHLSAAIEALTFTLIKNKILSTEDKEYIDSRLKS